MNVPWTVRDTHYNLDTVPNDATHLAIVYSFSPSNIMGIYPIDKLSLAKSQYPYDKGCPITLMWTQIPPERNVIAHMCQLGDKFRWKYIYSYMHKYDPEPQLI